MSPLFVVGAPRSGTTFLMKGLNAHPGVRISEETRIMNGVVRFINETDGADYANLHAHFWKNHLKDSMGAVVERFYKEVLGVPDGVIWGDKNPHYVDRRINENTLERIVEVFPDVRFVNIVRDGRDVVSSIAGFGWLPVEQASDLWFDSVQYANRFSNSRDGHRMMTVRYESISKCDQHISDIHEWLGVDYSSTVDEWQKAHAGKTPFRSARSLTASNKDGNWHKADEYLGERLIRWGYK